MAKKKPNPKTSNVENSTSKPEVAAVKVDTKIEPNRKQKKTVKNNASEKKPNIFKRMWKGIKGIFSELKKVTWPKGKEVGSNTAVVLVVVVVFFVVLFAIDYVLAGLLGLITTGEWTHLFG